MCEDSENKTQQKTKNSGSNDNKASERLVSRGVARRRQKVNGDKDEAGHVPPVRKARPVVKEGLGSRRTRFKAECVIDLLSITASHMTWALLRPQIPHL